MPILPKDRTSPLYAELVARQRLARANAGVPVASNPSAAAPAASPENDYEVGYCKPPKASQFKPGRSGNPAGRPKGSKNVASLIARLLSDRVRIRTPEGERRVTYSEAIAMKLREKAVKGDSRAAEKLFAWFDAAISAHEQRAGAQGDRAGDTTAADEAALQAFRDMILAEHAVHTAANDTDEEE